MVRGQASPGPEIHAAEGAAQAHDDDGSYSPWTFHAFTLARAHCDPPPPFCLFSGQSPGITVARKESARAPANSEGASGDLAGTGSGRRKEALGEPSVPGDLIF